VRVRFLTSVAGPRFSWAPGDVVDLPAEQAQVWADGVRAELVDPKARQAGKDRQTTAARPRRAAGRRGPRRAERG